MLGKARALELKGPDSCLDLMLSTLQASVSSPVKWEYHPPIVVRIKRSSVHRGQGLGHRGCSMDAGFLPSWFLTFKLHLLTWAFRAQHGVKVSRGPT